jgi:hypothetical protein
LVETGLQQRFEEKLEEQGRGQEEIKQRLETFF